MVCRHGGPSGPARKAKKTRSGQDDLSSEEDAAAHYDIAMVHVIATLVAGIQRSGLLLDALAHRSQILGSR
jgi:hypothetical protein